MSVGRTGPPVAPTVMLDTLRLVENVTVSSSVLDVFKNDLEIVILDVIMQG